MFCPYCGRENNEDALFCVYCKKALPPKNSQISTPTNLNLKKKSKPRISNNAIRAIITVMAIVVLIVVVLQIYYPSVFPWN